MTGGAFLAVADRLLGVMGRQATRFLAAGIFLGVIVPPLAAAARPLLPVAIFVLMLVTVLRLEPAAVRASLGRPKLLALAVLWVLVGAPMLVAPIAQLAAPGFLGDHLILTAASAPLIGGIAYALILGLDAAFALALGVIATALVPLTLPPLAGLVIGVELTTSPVSLLARLVALIGGASVVAILLRGWLGAARVRDVSPALDGIAVLALLAFGLAVMDGVTAMAIAEPRFVVDCLFAVFALAIGLNLVGTLLFAWCGWRIAMTVGLMSGFKNFGLVVAAMGGGADPKTVVFLGLAQFPIYLLPSLLKRFVVRRGSPEETTP